MFFPRLVSQADTRHHRSADRSQASEKEVKKNVATNPVSSISLSHGAPVGQRVVNASLGQLWGASGEKANPLAGKCPRWDLLNGPEVPLEDRGWRPSSRSLSASPG